MQYAIFNMQYLADYPRFLEDWWINVTLDLLGCNSLQEKEHQLVQRIQGLSDRFTKERSELVEDYFTDPANLCAYGLFFFPQSYARTQFVMQEILSRGWKPSGPVSILDLGSGAGPASFSAASFFNAPRVTAIDRSTVALSHMKKIASLWPQLEFECHVGDLWRWIKKPDRKWDLILASFSFNESGFSIRQTTTLLANALTERGMIIVMEPALRSTSETLEAWRDHISQQGDLQIWGPCLHHRLCPLLKEGKFWCHEVRSWRFPASIAFLNRHLYRQVHVLKFSFLALGKQAPPAVSSFSFRLISPVFRQRKKLVFTGCTSDGEKKEFRMNRPLTKEGRNQIQNWERGDVVSFPLNQERLS
ncbi:small ribosomal subunit Rsm22 family protein [bacterium]|nr:small ribosomal subunit Rsm22 family protein [bacterium]